tara:strand:+ start:136 stop:1185 length:1050 start_codon:yes stop_codon:yes gene_type:complete
MRKNFFINENKTIKETLIKLSKCATKGLAVVNSSKKLIGVISDGDIRKKLITGINLNSPIKKICNKKPIFFKKNNIKHNFVSKLFKDKKIDIIPIIDKNKKLYRVIHWSDIIENKLKTNFVPVVILAGGKGTRLRPFAKILPKPLIPINNKTLIENIIQKFREENFNHFIFTLNYKKNILESFLKGLSYKNAILETLHEKKPLGTSGCLSVLKRFSYNEFVVTNCDMYIDVDYKKILQFHKKNKNDLTIISSTYEMQIPYGIIKKNRRFKFLQLQEKPSFKSNINLGSYIVGKKIFNLLTNNKYEDMNKTIMKAKKRGLNIGLYNIGKDKWFDYGDWEKFNKNTTNFFN